MRGISGTFRRAGARLSSLNINVTGERAVVGDWKYQWRLLDWDSSLEISLNMFIRDLVPKSPIVKILNKFCFSANIFWSYNWQRIRDMCKIKYVFDYNLGYFSPGRNNTQRNWYACCRQNIKKRCRICYQIIDQVLMIFFRKMCTIMIIIIINFVL